MTGVGTETKVVNPGCVPGEIERFGHRLELSGFAEHHLPHVHVRCKTLRVNDLIKVSIYFCHSWQNFVICLIAKQIVNCCSLPEAATNRPQGDMRAR